MDEPFTANVDRVQELSRPDQDALDQVAESGFTPDLPLTPDSRAHRLVRLLDLLDPPDTINDASRALMVDVVMARVLRQPRSAGAVGRIGGHAPCLDEADTLAVDDLVETEWAPTRDDAHQHAVHELCRLIDVGEPIDAQRRTTLVGTTLDRVQAQIDRNAERMRLDTDDERLARPSGLRLADLASVAAVVLIGFAVLWPMLATLRERARIASGAANLNSSAVGFTLYAADHHDYLPQANASFLRGRWWDVGNPDRSHSANLFALVREKYTTMHELSSPGNPDAPTHLIDPTARDWRRPEEISFSYQLFTTPPRWGENPRMVVLTDRSPAIERARRGESFSPSATSLNHPGHGQHVLFADGRVVFFRKPELPWGDHLWIPRSLEGREGLVELSVFERPEDREDAYVGP